MGDSLFPLIMILLTKMQFEIKGEIYDEKL